MTDRDTRPTGPTLSRSYNATLASWAAAGHDAEPICEDCGTDLTGKPVVEDDCGWFCVKCGLDRAVDLSSSDWPAPLADESYDSDGRLTSLPLPPWKTEF